MKKPRPINVNVLTYRFPCTAIASILHRVSGVILFLAVPLLLVLLHLSLIDSSHFEAVKAAAAHPLLKIVLWLVLAAVIYHVLAGVRHLIMDLGAGESLRTARATAMAVMVISAILIILSALWFW